MISFAQTIEQTIASPAEYFYRYRCKHSFNSHGRAEPAAFLTNETEKLVYVSESKVLPCIFPSIQITEKNKIKKKAEVTQIVLNMNMSGE